MVNFLRMAPGSNLPALMEMLQVALDQVGIAVHFQSAGSVHHMRCLQNQVQSTILNIL